jgi:hypothetical protein
MEMRDPEVRSGKIWACLAAIGRLGQVEKSCVCQSDLAAIMQLAIDGDCGWLDVSDSSYYHEKVSVAPATIGNGLVMNSWPGGRIEETSVIAIV